jgi:hypothetical protein
MISIITTTEVSTAVLGDVAITFAESGSVGFWRQLLDYDWARWAPDAEPREVAEDFVFYTIEYENPESDDPPLLRTDITPALLAEGIGMLLRGQHLEDLGAMDAGEADLAVQLAIFGEEVFA